MTAVVELMELLPPAVTKAIRGDAPRSPDECAAAVLLALSAQPRFQHLLHTLTDPSISPCAKDGVGAARRGGARRGVRCGIACGGCPPVLGFGRPGARG
jgi:hypothetical protein